MFIEDLRAELTNNSYSTDDVAALAALQAKTESVVGALDAGKKLKLRAFGASVIQSLNAQTSNATSVAIGDVTVTVGDMCTAALANIESPYVDLDLTDPETMGMMALLESAGVLTSNQVALVTSLAMRVSYPFASATLRDVAEARNRDNSQSINWTGQRFLAINTQDTLEGINPLVTVSNASISNYPIGRTVRITTAGSYVVDLTGVTNYAIAPANLTVQMWLPCNFNLGLF